MEKWEYKSLEWLHKAREEAFNKTKNLSPKELIEKTRATAEGTAKAWGLKLVKSRERVH